MSSACRTVARRCCLRPYTAARAVVSFLRSLANTQAISCNLDDNADPLTVDGSAAKHNIQHRGSCVDENNNDTANSNTEHQFHGAMAQTATSFHSAMQSFLYATQGAPASLMHEGPLHCEDLCAVQTHLSACTMSELLRTAYDGALQSCVPHTLASLWPDELLQQYMAAVLHARRERIQSQKSQLVACCSAKNKVDGNNTITTMNAASDVAGSNALSNKSDRGSGRRRRDNDGGHSVVNACIADDDAARRYESGWVARRVFCPHTLPSTFAVGMASASEPVHAARHYWADLIDRYTPFLPDRSALHELENLPQEMALVELMMCCAKALSNASESHCVATSASSSNSGLTKGQVSDLYASYLRCSVLEVRASSPVPFSHASPPMSCVVDVGGGNGFLATLASERLRCRAVVVDPHFPAHALDCRPRPWPETTPRHFPARTPARSLGRCVCWGEALRWSSDVQADPDETMLVAKHLCGSAMDACLRQCEQQNVWPRALVLAPCCFNKIDMHRYVNGSFLQSALRLGSPGALDRVSRLTDWNCSCHACVNESARVAHTQHPNAKIAKDVHLAHDMWRGFRFTSSDSAEHDVPPVRRGSYRSTVRLLPCMHGFAQYVEALLNYGRVQWLKERGYGVCVVQYVPSCVTPKNKCILAIRPSRAQWLP